MNKIKLRLSQLKRANHGFSLVEIIIAMALLLIIVFAFTTLFSFAFGGIFSQGRKSGALFEGVQRSLEERYEAKDAGDTDTMEIDFDDENITNPTVDGEVIELEYNFEDKTGVVYTFIPNSQ